jgi:hypothetical protein
MVKMPKSAKIPALVKRVAQKVEPKPLTREEQMDAAARKTAAEMDKINYDKSIEFRIMNEPDIIRSHRGLRSGTPRRRGARLPI